MTVDEFAENCIKPAANWLLLRIAKERNYSEADTQVLVTRFEADPIAVSEELFGVTS